VFPTQSVWLSALRSSIYPAVAWAVAIYLVASLVEHGNWVSVTALLAALVTAAACALSIMLYLVLVSRRFSIAVDGQLLKLESKCGFLRWRSSRPLSSIHRIVIRPLIERQRGKTGFDTRLKDAHVVDAQRWSYATVEGKSKPLHLVDAETEPLIALSRCLATEIGKRAANGQPIEVVAEAKPKPNEESDNDVMLATSNQGNIDLTETLDGVRLTIPPYGLIRGRAKLTLPLFVFLSVTLVAAGLAIDHHLSMSAVGRLTLITSILGSIVMAWLAFAEYRLATRQRNVAINEDGIVISRPGATRTIRSVIPRDRLSAIETRRSWVLSESMMDVVIKSGPVGRFVIDGLKADQARWLAAAMRKATGLPMKR
jgi:hypothetical protein